MKTEQVRIPADLAKDARVVSAELGESLPEYVSRVLRQAVQKDLPKVSKLIAKRAEQAGKASGQENE